jgi:hypothetical protein
MFVEALKIVIIMSHDCIYFIYALSVVKRVTYLLVFLPALVPPTFWSVPHFWGAQAKSGGTKKKFFRRFAPDELQQLVPPTFEMLAAPMKGSRIMSRSGPQKVLVSVSSQAKNQRSQSCLSFSENFGRVSG